MDTIAERLKSARKSRGMSQTTLAEMAGCAQSSIAIIENGRSQGSRYIAQIAAALGVDPLWLATGEGDAGLGATPRMPLKASSHASSSNDLGLLEAAAVEMFKKALRTGAVTHAECLTLMTDWQSRMDNTSSNRASKSAESSPNA